MAANDYSNGYYETEITKLKELKEKDSQRSASKEDQRRSKSLIIAVREPVLLCCAFAFIV